MAKPIQAICRNTFITFFDEDVDDLTPALLLPHRKLPPRSRSAEVARRKPEAEELQELSNQSLQGLNAVLSADFSSTVRWHKDVDQTEVLEDRNMLSKVLAAYPSPKQTPWGEHHHFPSGSSLSTMVPDDASECGFSCRGGLKRMPHVWSSGSVSTMVSDRFFDEEHEVKFELDIEEGGASSRQKETAMPRAMDSAVIASGHHSAIPSSPEMSHSQVPRHHNMVEKYNATRDEPPTTMMIRNIPGRYSQQDLMADLQELGLNGVYDFLYIPIDKNTAANVGYAFVNFVDAVWAEMCRQSFENYHFLRRGQKRSSKKVAIVSVAHLQGLEKNLQHYENSAVNMSRDKRRKPILLPSMAKMCA